MPRSRSRRLITLSTDIGPIYAAQMKAVLAALAPGIRVVDLTHDLPAHRISEGAFLLLHMAVRFPAASIHVAVVDPGVGTARAAVAVECEERTWLVGPDNGILFPLAQALGFKRSWRIDPTRVSKVPPSPTFEGRDVFAPTAARLALGATGRTLGQPHSLKPLKIPAARRTSFGARGEVLHIDRFGNAITNVPTGWAPPPMARVQVRLRGGGVRSLRRLRTYGEMGPGEAGVIGSSFDLLELGAKEASVASRWKLETGDRVEFRWKGLRRAGAGKTG